MSSNSLYVAFKGKGNSSNRIVSSFVGDKLFLTNSYIGIEKDIDSVDDTYDLVYMFGLDKKLKGDIKIESIAVKDDVSLCSDVDLESIRTKLNQNGIVANIGNMPTKCLCNEAYWYMLRKFSNHVVFFHVPSIKYITEEYIDKIKNAISYDKLLMKY